jgi:V/A-type H+/Na+-transporting ATPase subunit C
MSGFDYGNARLRAMKSRLLSRRELEALAETGTLRGMITALTKTAYRKPVEVALVHAIGMECINEALREDLGDTLGKARRFYQEGAGEIVAVVLWAYDVLNLKAILRGLARNAPTEDILAALVPVGTLDFTILAELARAQSVRAAINMLASLGSPFARPLMKLRVELPGADASRMELALDQWRFQEARKFLQELPQRQDILASAIDLEADLTNSLTALRFAHTMEERKLLREWTGSEDLEQIFVGPGTIPFDLLLSAGMQDTLEAGINMLATSAWGPSLKAGMQAYAKTGRLSDLERHLHHYRLEWMAQQITRDPLGVGVLLGYFALKVNEISNLRWIANGIRLGLEPNAIRAELEFLS